MVTPLLGQPLTTSSSSILGFEAFYTTEKANRCVACGEEGHYLRCSQNKARRYQLCVLLLAWGLHTPFVPPLHARLLCTCRLCQCLPGMDLPGTQVPSCACRLPQGHARLPQEPPQVGTGRPGCLLVCP